MTPP
jgi:hypothetical protein